MLQCNQGMAPSSLMVMDASRPMVGGMLQATIMDFAPMTNVMPFGMCRSMANPQVAAATAAAMGVLTPMPCAPVIVSPWSPSGKVMIGGMPSLMNNSKCMCAWGGQISINNAGQTQVNE